MGKCIALGFKVYPIVYDKYRKKRWPPVILAYSYGGLETVSKKPEFQQRFLTWRVHELYGKIYNSIKDKL